MDERSRHREFEERFIQQLRARALALTQTRFTADGVRIEPTPEGADSLRAELSRLEIYDRNALETLPGSHSMQLRFQRKLLGGLVTNTVSRMRVRVLAPIEMLISGSAAGPVGRDDVLNALARYPLLPARERPTSVVLASATGFSDEAKRLVGMGPPTLILMGGRDDGGWDVTLPDAVKKSPWAKLFELESDDARLNRLMRHLESDSHTLETRGLPIDGVAEKLGVGKLEAERLVRQASRRESRLFTVVHDGEVHLCRTPFGDEGNTMSLWSRIRKLLRMKPTAAERVRELTAQRVRLEQQRHDIDQRMDRFEADERTAIQEGAAAKSDAIRKQIAGKLLRTRKELTRLRAQAQLFTNQIDVIGTQIHHLTLTEQGRRVSLPSAEDLTSQAAEAEHMMAEFSANAELAQQIEVTGETPALADEEAAIFEEFRQAAEQEAPAKAEPQAPQPAARESAGPQRAPSQRAEPPPVPESNDRGERSRPARPEIG